VSPPPTCAACPRALETFSPKTDFVPALSCKGAASCRRWIRFTSVSLLGGFCFFLLFPREGQQQTKRAKRAGTARSGDFKGRGRVLGRRRDTSSLFLSSFPRLLSCLSSKRAKLVGEGNGGGEAGGDKPSAHGAAPGVRVLHRLQPSLGCVPKLGWS
jgi:hypothetical protein